MTTEEVKRKEHTLISGIQQRSLMSLLSGLLLALAFNVSELWLLGLVALVPFLFVLKNTASLRETVLHGFSVGLIHFGSVLSFFFSAHPLDWVGIDSGPVSIIGVTSFWLIASALFALGVALWSTVIQRLKNSTHLFLIAPTFWVLIEFAQATLFSVFFFGEGGLIGPHWTFGFLGYILAENIFLLSLAALGGVFLLSFVVVLTSTLVYRFIDNGKLRVVEVVSLMIMVAVAGLSFFYEPTPTGERNVVAFHTNFEPNFVQGINEQEKQFDEIDRLFRDLTTRSEHFDIIVLPENSYYFSRLPEISRTYRLDSLSRSGGVLIIDSARTNVPGPDESLVAFINSETNEVPLRSKRLLVPQGEYLSYGFSFISKIFLGDHWHEQFNDRRSLKRGESMVIGYSDGIGVGALFCSEVLTPNIYRDATMAGAEILVNSASHAVFTNSKILAAQILKYSKLRAVENGRYYVQAGNGVPSFALTNKGEILGEVDEEGSLVEVVALTFDHKTPFNRIGSLGVFMITALLAGTLLYIEQKRK